jgi:RIP metalloprotease RseP
MRLTFLVINFIKDLVTGEATARQLGGPIEIANLSYTAMRMGFLALMSWIALISLQLGIINLFPIPVLDGGQILVIILEGIFRRDFSPKVKQIVMQIGFAIFIVLIVFVILNDVVKRLPNGWNSLIPF